jgi:hypothetical protein
MSDTVKTRIRNGREELVPPAGGYQSHNGKPISCENDWHDTHRPSSKCEECGEVCPCLPQAELFGTSFKDPGDQGRRRRRRTLLSVH